MKKNKIIIGTRGSKLAVWQAEWIKSELSRFFDLEISLKIIKTTGDKILDTPLAKIGGKGLFVKEIENALLNEEIDIAVHSMKDMPAEIPEGLIIGAIPIREDARDALISKNDLKFKEMPPNMKIGTSSLRRSAQIKAKFPEAHIVSLRGNVDTRIKKLKEDNLDGIILATAGLKRLGYEEKISEKIDFDTILPSVGQGAICVEAREDDLDILNILSKINDEETNFIVTAERAFLKKLEGGCQVPIACMGKIENGELLLKGLVATLDGKKIIEDSVSGEREKANSIGLELADKLIKKGAKNILKCIL